MLFFWWALTLDGKRLVWAQIHRIRVQRMCRRAKRKGPPLLVPPTPYPQLYFWSGRPCIAPTSMTSAISKRLLPSALICSGSKGFCDGMFMGFYWISWDSRWNLRDFMGRRLWISWHFMGFSMDFTLIFMKKTCCCLLSCWNAWTKVKQRNSQDLRSRCQAAWSPSTQCWWAPNGLSMRFAMIVPWQPVDRFSSSLDHQHFRWCCDMARHGAEPCWALWCLPQLIKSIKSPRFSISSHKNHSSGSFFSAETLQTSAQKNTTASQTYDDDRSFQVLVMEILPSPGVQYLTRPVSITVWWGFYENVMGI